MFLEKLEIQGFKSFANKTYFVFPKGTNSSQSIAAIVGPNGSGKSNVADAIRWVLGEQSLKNLRSKKSEDVIFFGSDKKSQLGSCEVSLTFNNEDHRVPLEYSEVVITRRLYRSGESEYCINKNKVRLADVLLLLAQGQVGQRSYSVIGQGMADGIINASPLERKEFFDEAAGVRQYQIKKDQAQNRLKNTQENIGQTQMLLSELEPKLKFFQRHMKRLEQREEFEARLFDITRSYYATQWNQLHTQREKLIATQDAYAQQRIRVQNEYQLTQQKFSEKEKNLVRPYPVEYTELKNTQNAVLAKRQSLLSEQSLLEGRLRLSLEQEGKSQVSWLMKQCQEVRAQHSLLVQKKESATHEYHEMCEKEQEFEKKCAQLENELARLSLSHQEKKREQQKISSLQEVIAELENLAVHSKGVHESEADHQTLKQAIMGLTEKIHTLLERVREFSKADAPPKDEIHEQVIIIEQEQKKITREYAEIQVAVRVKHEYIESLGRECEKNTQELARLEKEIAYFSSTDKKEQTKVLEGQKEQLKKELEKTEKLIQEVSQKVEEYQTQERQSQKELLELQKELNKKQREMEDVQGQNTDLAVQLARLDAHQEDLLARLCRDLKIEESRAQELKMGIETVQSVLGFASIPAVESLDHAHREMERLRLTLEQIGSLDSEALQEYESTKERYEFLTTQLKDLHDATQTLQKALEELEGVITNRFEEAFKEINTKFDEYFKHLFHGGSAKLFVLKREVKNQQEGEEQGEDTSREEELISGIDIHATPPGKKLKNVSFLSGGEKALTSIALLCAILSVNPSPFVVLDEVDAALDESNASRFASIIKDLAVQTQFVIITHNRATIHIGEVLYGITMGDDGISHSLSLDITKASDTIS